MNIASALILEYNFSIFELLVEYFSKSTVPKYAPFSGDRGRS